MIEVIIKKYLDEHLDVPSFFEHQKDEPARFIILEKTSGAKQNHLLSSTFAFQSYAESLYEAALLNDKVKQVIEQLDVLPQVSGVHLNCYLSIFVDFFLFCAKIFCDFLLLKKNRVHL